VKRRLGIFLYSMGAGGAERVVSILLPELARRYDVTLILMNETLFYPVPEGVEIVWLERSRSDEAGWKKLVKLPLLGWRLKRLCDVRRIGTLWCLMNRPNYIGVLARMAGWRGRLILGERGTPSLQYAGGGLQARANRRLIRTLYLRADRVTANSHGARIDLQERFGVPAAKLSVLYNPFDPAVVAERCAPEPKEEGTFVFVTVGRLDEGKNHRLLIEAFAKIRRDRMRLWIVGDGPLRGALETLAEEEAGDAVRFFGTRDPFPLLAAADLFVFASRREGLPNVLIEALACGLPVISTDCRSGPREILAGETDYSRPTRGFRVVSHGILVEEENPDAMAAAMKEGYNNADLRRSLREKAKERARFFTKETALSRLIGILEV